MRRKLEANPENRQIEMLFNLKLNFQVCNFAQLWSCVISEIGWWGLENDDAGNSNVAMILSGDGKGDDLFVSAVTGGEERPVAIGGGFIEDVGVGRVVGAQTSFCYDLVTGEGPG